MCIEIAINAISPNGQVRPKHRAYFYMKKAKSYIDYYREAQRKYPDEGAYQFPVKIIKQTLKVSRGKAVYFLLK